jgi:hypothetical protein
MDLAFVAVMGSASSAVLLAWLYFSRYQVARPPLGVINLWDVAILLGAIVVVPFLYLLLPLGLVMGLLAAAYLTVLYTAAEPVLRTRWAIWVTVLALLAVDVCAAHRFGSASLPFFAVNNVVLVAVVVGVANLWAQSGLKAQDAAVLGAALAIYDLVATTFLPLMTDLVTRLTEIPFAPMVAWVIDDEGHWLGIGLGDLLLAAVYPLVLRRAFGERAGVVAMATGLAVIGGLLAVVQLRVVTGGLPAMVVLGPLMVLQYAYWSRCRGGERTTWQYLGQASH